MNDNTSWLVPLQQSFSRLLDLVLRYLPQVLGALVLVLIGWLLAVLLRMLMVRMIRGLDWFLPRILPGTLGASLHKVLQPGLFGGIVFWVVLLAFIAAATQLLGLTVFSSWLDALFNWLPLILLAGLLVISSIIVSQLAREGAIRAASAAGVEHSLLLGYALQSVILITAVVIALDLLGLDITFLVVLAGILAGATLGGVALAFGLGSKKLIGNLLGMRNIQPGLKEGDSIKIGEIEGRVSELGKGSLILETREGKVSIPGSYFSKYPCTILMEERRG